MKKKLNVIFACLLISIFVCTISSTTASAKTYTFRLANFYPPMSSFNSAVWPFWAEKLAKASNGAIQIKVYPAEQLVKAEDLWEAVEHGICDIGHFFLMFEAGRFPISEYGYLPLMFSSSRTCGMVMTELYEKYPQIQEEFKNVKVLWFNGNAPAQFFTTKKKIDGLDDLNGLKINGGGLYWKHVAKELNFAPISLPFPEIYDALSKGAIDGNTVEWEGQYIFKWFEIDEYSLGKVNLYIYPFILCMNKHKWESLPPEIQKVFTEFSGVKGAEMTGYIFDQHDLSAKTQITEYIKKRNLPKIQYLSEESFEKLKKKLEPVRDLWRQEMEKIGVPGDQIIKDAESIERELTQGPPLKYWKENELIEKTQF